MAQTIEEMAQEIETYHARGRLREEAPPMSSDAVLDLIRRVQRLERFAFGSSKPT